MLLYITMNSHALLGNSRKTKRKLFMNVIKSKSILLLLFSLLITGCYTKIHYRYRPCHDDKPLKILPRQKSAIVTGRDGLLEIHSIDTCPDFILLRPGVEVHLLPGIHSVVLTTIPFKDPAGYTIYSKIKKGIKFDTIEGHMYEFQYIGIGDWTVNGVGEVKGGWDVKLVDLGKMN